MQAQLARSLGASEVDHYLDSPEWGMSQKLDGQRVVLSVGGGEYTAYNRNGGERKIPVDLGRYLSRFPTNLTLDGELMGDGTYHVFDMLVSGGHNIKFWPLTKRYKILCALTAKMKADLIQHVPLLTDGKLEAFAKLQEGDAEGVIFKRLDAPYSGGRNTNWMKFKWQHDIDCVVMPSVDDKQNLQLGVYKDGELVNVGACSALTGDGPQTNVDDVVKVTCLYVTDSDRLYHAVYPLIRTDKRPEDCTFDQLDECRTDKKVRL